MERTLLPAERLTEFGPNPFAADQELLAEAIEGKRPRDLKSAVMSRCENTAGVYGFLDEHGVLIYVGKSKQLRSRLLSYFSPKLRRRKPGRLIRQARGILWEPAPSEFAALLRELQLIQKFRPLYNVKDQPHRGRPTYLSLGLPGVPGFFVTSTPAGDALAAFGPFWAGPKLDRAAGALNRLYGLRDCASSQPMAFSDQAELLGSDVSPGCLRFDLGTCLGPCVAACSKTAYFRRVKSAQRFLEGESNKVIETLAARMNRSALDRQFELAARHRDDLKSLEFLQRRLRRIRRIEQEFHFIYPQDSLWYLIRGGRIAGVAKPPACPQTAAIARGSIEQIYSPARPAVDLTSPRPDTLLLVASWFRRNPSELAKTVSPQAALHRCRKQGSRNG